MNTIKIILLTILVTQVVACNPFDLLFKVSDTVWGIDRELVILESQPYLIDQTTKTYKAEQDYGVVGNSYGVCFAIQSPYDNNSVKKTREDIRKSLNDATLTVELLDVKGNRHISSKSSEEINWKWSMSGEITKKSELAVCVSCNCESNVAIGNNIMEISISADKPINVLGSYWESDNESEKTAEAHQKFHRDD